MSFMMTVLFSVGAAANWQLSGRCLNTMPDTGTGGGSQQGGRRPNQGGSWGRPNQQGSGGGTGQPNQQGPWGQPSQQGPWGQPNQQGPWGQPNQQGGGMRQPGGWRPPPVEYIFKTGSLYFHYYETWFGCNFLVVIFWLEHLGGTYVGAPVSHMTQQWQMVNKMSMKQS